MRSFWPVSEAAQADYETLRQAVLAGDETLSIAAGRFGRRGLAGLISWPDAEAVFAASVVGATRPAWTPHNDPRLDALAAGFELLRAAPLDLAVITKEAHR